MQLLLAQVLEKRAAGAVHDALGHARGSRGEQDVQRVVERQLLEVDLVAGLRRDEVVEALRARHPRYVRRGAHVGHDDRAQEARAGRPRSRAVLPRESRVFPL